jgi:hypothetical protein
MTDKELFKLRLNGDVKKEIVTEFNRTYDGGAEE